MSNTQLNYAFLVYRIILTEINKTYYFSPKIDHLRKKLRIMQNYISSQQVWKGTNSEEKRFDLMETTFLGQISKTGQILQKTIFLHKISNISPTKLSRCFESFREVDWKFTFWIS